MKKLERIHILSRAENLQSLRKFVYDFLSGLGCKDESVKEIVLAVNEACMNVIQHAYKNSDDGEIILEFYKNKNELMMRVIDYADQVDLSLIKSRNLDDIRPGGLGVHLISRLMDSVEYKHLPHESGNFLEMHKKIF
ncbi:Serine-protein kinase RsbW [hydrothermal vent metagenome]|uniref:Serine-protein kinase RsbW n=1 Tax=hydrothermal vent metagenome TaxID=652676 RepID=A0A3B0YF46_9ZZZZ